MESGYPQHSHSHGRKTDRITIREDEIVPLAIKHRQTLWQKTEALAKGVIDPKQLLALKSQELFQQNRITERYAEKKVVVEEPAVNLAMEKKRAEEDHLKTLEFIRNRKAAMAQNMDNAAMTLKEHKREAPRGPMPPLEGGPGEEKATFPKHTGEEKVKVQDKPKVTKPQLESSPRLTSMAVGDEEYVEVNYDNDSDDEQVDEEGYFTV